MKRLLPILAAALLAGCVAQTTVETRLVSDPAVVDARRRAEIHTSLASQYYQRGNFVVALDETRLALKEDSNYYQAFNVQALIYMELREDTQARQAFEKALSMAPRDPDVLNNYGLFLCLRGDNARGMEYFNRVLTDSMYTTPEKVLLNAGVCSRIAGRNVEAEGYLRRAVVFKPDLAGALYNLAEILYEKGSYKESENYLVRYMRLGEPTLSALVLGVKLARAQNEKEAADSMMQQLRRRFPDAPQTRDLEKGAARS
ncbi:MAG: type IV pilus biogenesis/stability protein PilW [Betaproteobacteria bacterium]|nr:type IV pilus biogenesis/stability protein PilW [Betaproteobacteria bacterium]